MGKIKTFLEKETVFASGLILSLGFILYAGSRYDPANLFSHMGLALFLYFLVRVAFKDKSAALYAALLFISNPAQAGAITAGGKGAIGYITFFSLIGCSLISLALFRLGTLEFVQDRLLGKFIFRLGFWSILVFCSLSTIAWLHQHAAPHPFRISTDRSHQVKMHNQIGNILSTQKRREEAVLHYTEALRIDPAYAKGHNNLGNALAEQGKFHEAAGHFSEAIRLDPEYFEAHYNLGSINFKLKKIEDAIKNFSDALRVHPEFPEAEFNLGMALIQKQWYEEAIVHLERALAGRPDFAEAHFNLGVALLTRDMKKEAMAHFSEAIRINPALSKTLSQLKNMPAWRDN